MSDGVGRGKQENQKLKPYLVLSYLMKYSDEDNPIPASDIVAYLVESGVPAERRSIYRDIAEINKAIYMTENDCDIYEAEEAVEDDEEKTVVYDSHKKGFYVRQRHFEISDIQLIAECVCAARFISESKSKSLLEVIKGFVSEPQAEKIKHDVFLVDRIKTENRFVHTYIATINDAMSTEREGEKHIPEKIGFKYFKYSPSGMEQKPIRNGDTYVVSPYKLLINDGNYYLLGFDDKKQDMRTFRVDRMRDVRLLGAPRCGAEKFKEIDIRTYTQRVFSMYGGKEENVQIRFSNFLLDAVVDQFGTKGASYSQYDERHFTVNTKVEVSPQFYAWLCRFGKAAKILSPQEVINGFKQHVDKIREMYES